MCVFELIFFSPNIKNILWSWFVDGSNMMNHLNIPSNQQNVTCFSYICWWIGLLLDHCLVILAWPQYPYNWDYYCFVFINPLYRLLLSIYVGLVVFCDCVELWHSEGVIIMVLLVSTPLLLYKGFLEKNLKGPIQQRCW